MSRILSEGEVTHSVKSYDRFEWTIHNFFSRAVGTYVESPGFLFEEIIWHMAIGTKEKTSSPSVFLNLWRTQSSGSRYLVRLGVKNKNNRDCMIISYETDSDGFLEVRKFLPWHEKVPLTADKLIPKGCLTVFCEICPAKKSKSKLADTTISLLIENLKDMYLSGLNSDVELKVEDKIFKAHKAILSARCPVFASMFQHDMQENSSGVVDIPDCSADAFKVFLLYLYTGKVDDCTLETVCDLYYIVDKYGAQELKEHCTSFMKTRLSVDSFCDIIALSLRHNESELLKVATDFFSQHVKLIIKTAKWQIYVKEYPIHANELYIKALDA